MKLYARSTIRLHDLYHRQEGERYVLGDPETGAYLFVSPDEFHAVRMFRSGHAVGMVRRAMLERNVDVDDLINRLARRRLIYMIDERIVARKHEPVHEFDVPMRHFGNPAVKFLMALLCIWGLATLVFKGTIPGAGAFFYGESLSLLFIAATIVAWLIVLIRALAKYGQAQYLGLHARFGFAPAYHFFLPRAFIPPVTEYQNRRIVGNGLLALLATVSVAVMAATWTGNPFYQFIVLIGVIEILSECLLFMDTDLAEYIASVRNIHRLNEQTKDILRDDLKLFASGESRPSHKIFTNYAFFYMFSIALGALLALFYIMPIAIEYVVTAFRLFIPNSTTFADATLAILLFAVNLLLYGFSLLRHHPLAHNRFFVNTSMFAIIIASYLLTTLIATWSGFSMSWVLAIIVLYALGFVLVLVFERAMHLAHPWSELHTVFETIILPFVAATVPLSVLFTVPSQDNTLYLAAAMVALGMLSALAIRDVAKTHKWLRERAQTYN